MKKKSLFIILGSVLVFLIAIILILNLFGFLSILPSGTAYGSYAISPDGKTLTLSNFWKYDGFRTNHYLSGECDLAGGCHMYDHSSPYYLYFIQLNGIDSTQFSLGGHLDICAFSPKNLIETPIYKNELESLGFKYYQKTEGYWTYVGDYRSVCGFPCPECQTYGCDKYSNRCCQAFIKFVPTSEHACWEGLGTITQTNLNSHIPKLTCSVTGTVTQLCEGNQIISTHCTPHNQPYDIQGVVRTIGTGYYCEIDMTELNNLLPSQIMIPSRDTLQPRGIIAVSNPKVIFELAQQKTFYRLENNLCVPITIMENAKTSNDYETLIECKENMAEVEETFYRLENNLCSIVNIFPSEKTINDYKTLTECKSKITITPPPQPKPTLLQWFDNLWDWIKGVFS